MFDSLRKHIKYAKNEASLVFVTALVSAFILSFNQWGIKEFDFAYGIRNLILTTVIVLASFLIKLSVQKYYAHKYGLDAVFKPWIPGLILGILFVILSNGNLIFLGFGGLMFIAVNKMAYGQPKEYMSFIKIGWISVLGPIVNVVIALLARLIFPVDDTLMISIVQANVWLALFNILPIPFVHKFIPGGEKKFGTSDGIKLLYASISQYLLVLVLIIIDSFVILLLNRTIALFVVVASLLIMRLAYYILYQQNVKRSSHSVYKYRF